MRRLPGVIVLLCTATALGWGPDGHRIVGKIADHYVSEAARPELAAILRLYHATSLADVSNWPDHIKHARPETAPWHYVDIPVNADRYDPDRDCSQGDCVVEAIHRFATELGDRTRSISNRADALSFVVHFVGDIHQPLHCAEDNDRGGNDVVVLIDGETSNLHRLWDFEIIRATGLDPDHYVDRLLAEFGSDTNVLAICHSGSVEDWANESHDLARDFVYAGLPESHQVGSSFLASCRPVADQQLFKAGFRLARLLNACLAPKSDTPQP